MKLYRAYIGNPYADSYKIEFWAESSEEIRQEIRKMTNDNDYVEKLFIIGNEVRFER